MFIGGACPSCTLGTSLLLCNVVNRAMSDVQVKCMPICIFISKLILYTPTCKYGIFILKIISKYSPVG